MLNFQDLKETKSYVCQEMYDCKDLGWEREFLSLSGPSHKCEVKCFIAEIISYDHL